MVIQTILNVSEFFTYKKTGACNQIFLPETVTCKTKVVFPGNRGVSLVINYSDLVLKCFSLA